MAEFPTLFLSHGAPNLTLYANPARDFLSKLAGEIGKPQAIIIASAHFESSVPSFSADEKPGMLYDFKGFEAQLYQKVYPAPGLPELATIAANLVEQAGFPVQEVTGRGYDYGAWSPLSLMYPDADIPVVEMAIQPEEGCGHHFVVGRALAPLRKHGILIIGSGGLTHNFDEMFDSHQDFVSPAPDFVKEFAEWVREKAEAGATDEIIDFRALAPHAAIHHPKSDHFLPLAFALGAAGEGAKGKRLHTSVQRGGLVMDSYLFQ
jgi:4,5-DOPA dioxygenase extradiol